MNHPRVVSFLQKSLERKYFKLSRPQSLSMELLSSALESKSGQRQDTDDGHAVIPIKLYKEASSSTVCPAPD